MERFQGTWICDYGQSKGMEEAMRAMKLDEEHRTLFRGTKRLLQYKVEGDRVTVLEAELGNVNVFSYKLEEKFAKKGLHDEDVESTIQLKDGKLIEQERIVSSKFFSEPQDFEVTMEFEDDDNLVQNVVVGGCPVSNKYVKKL